MKKKISERENTLKAYRHEKTEWLPLSYDALMHIGFISGNECGLGSADLKDIFGVHWIIKGDPTPDPNEPYMLEDICEWRDKITFPEPKKWDWDAIGEAELKEYDGNKVVTCFCEQGLFDRLTVLGGFENALMWLITDPDECRALFDRIADYKIELIECVGKYIKPDVFMYTDDIAKIDGLFMSPQTYREVIKPSHARIIAAIHENGMIAEQHTCGKIDDIIDDYMEIGVESFFPAQVVNDLVGMRKKYADKLTLVGGFNSQGLPGRIDASDEIVKEEARRIVEDYKDLGGFIVMPMIMDGTLNWSVYEPSHRQKVFHDEFYNCMGIDE